MPPAHRRSILLIVLTLVVLGTGGLVVRPWSEASPPITHETEPYPELSARLRGPRDAVDEGGRGAAAREAMLERLRARLRSGDPPTIVAALVEVRALGTGGLALAEDVIRLLKAEAFPVRRAAADALVSMGGEAADLLSMTIRAESERAGQPLVWALELAPGVMERTGSSAALSAARCLVHRYAYFVGAVSLAQMADAEVDLSVAAPLVVKGLDPTVDATRLFFALDAVSHLGSRAVEALPAMTVLLDDRRPEVRAKAVRALHDLGPAAAPALPHLERLLAYPESAGGVPAGILAAAIRRISAQE